MMVETFIRGHILGLLICGENGYMPFSVALHRRRSAFGSLKNQVEIALHAQSKDFWPGTKLSADTVLVVRKIKCSEGRRTTIERTWKVQRFRSIRHLVSRKRVSAEAYD